MKTTLFATAFIALFLLSGCTKKEPDPEPQAKDPADLIVDHNNIRLSDIPAQYITLARNNLHIAYEHTSHGSQITDGMSGLSIWKGADFAWNNGGTGGALDIDDYGITGGSDLGNPDYTAWEASTRTYLNKAGNSNINVVMWSWCGEVSYASEANISNYLSLMSGLEHDYPSLKFVYMTGHLDGTGLAGNLHLRNEQIRNYCKTNNKILFDFEDIESYDPDGFILEAKFQRMPAITIVTAMVLRTETGQRSGRIIIS